MTFSHDAYYVAWNLVTMHITLHEIYFAYFYTCSWIFEIIFYKLQTYKKTKENKKFNSYVLSNTRNNKELNYN